MRGEDSAQPQVAIARRGGLSTGLVSGVAVAAIAAGFIVWSMAAHDPYWRLFETTSIPAPVYESAAEIEAALANASVDAPRPDSAAVRPDFPDAVRTRPPDAALAFLPPRPAEPMVAVPAALAPGADEPASVAAAPPAAPGTVSGAAPSMAGPDSPGVALARAPDAAPADSAIAPIPAAGGSAAAPRAGAEPVAPPAPLPLAVTLFVPEASVGSAVAGHASLAPVAVPATPDRLRVRADESSEEALALVRADRVRIQRRLALAGFDPRGFDGVFGPHTRRAIADFQLASGLPATGYLDGAALADLSARTEEAYAAYAARAARDRRAAPKQAPVAEERRLARAPEPGRCARDAAGRIVPRQSLGCDLKGFAEKTVSLGRDRLAFEETGGLTGFGARPDR